MTTPEQIYKILQAISSSEKDIPKPGKLLPVKRQYSQSLLWFKKVPVTLLIEVIAKTHHRAKKPSIMKPGTTAYVALGPDGVVNLFPFEMAGTGYELVVDAIEGEHFEFKKGSI